MHDYHGMMRASGREMSNDSLMEGHVRWTKREKAVDQGGEPFAGLYELGPGTGDLVWRGQIAE